MIIASLKLQRSARLLENCDQNPFHAEDRTDDTVVKDSAIIGPGLLHALSSHLHNKVRMSLTSTFGDVTDLI
jgi:hypothetical protein